MTELWLVRHGETDWNRERRFQGHADPPLNDTGREQARALAEELAGAGIAAVYTSDLARARETAQIVADRLGVEAVPLRELREIDVGEWQGLTWPEIGERFPEGVAAWRARGHGWESGESYAELAERVVEALKRIAAENRGRRVLVVAHGGTVRATKASIDGVTVAESRTRSGPAANCEIFRIVARNGGFTAGPTD